MGLYDSLMKSNMSPDAKTGVLDKVFEGIKSTGIEQVKSHALAAGHVVRSAGESVIVAGALAAAHVELKNGLDVAITLPGQSGKGAVVALDGAVAALGLIGSVALSQHEVGTDLRNAGNTGLSIFTFRKTFAFLSTKKKLAGGIPGGTFAGEGEEAAVQSVRSTVVDPVVTQAKRMAR